MEQRYEMHAIMQGRVQGVGFRASTCSYARQLGLVGTVKNLADGNVEIIAQGSKFQLEELVRLLKEESSFEQVDHALLEFASIKVPISEFRIIR